MVIRNVGHVQLTLKVKEIIIIVVSKGTGRVVIIKETKLYEHHLYTVAAAVVVMVVLVVTVKVKVLVGVGSGAFLFFIFL